MLTNEQTSLRFSEIAVYFETLTPDTTQAIAQFYSSDCTFKDPFNEVRGVEHTKRIFLHMFSALIRPHFVITGQVVQGNEAFLVWDFVFEMPRFVKGEQRVRGTSHLKLSSDGLISFHRDYWDAAEELYEKLPVLGALMRLLKRQNRVA